MSKLRPSERAAEREENQSTDPDSVGAIVSDDQ